MICFPVLECVWFFSVISISLLRFHTVLFVVSMFFSILFNVGVLAALNHVC